MKRTPLSDAKTKALSGRPGPITLEVASLAADMSADSFLDTHTPRAVRS